MSTLWDTIAKGIKDGAKIAKEGAFIAVEKAEELSKKSKVHIEMSNIKRKIEKSFTDLGGNTYHLLQEEKVKDVMSNEEIKKLVGEINTLEEGLKKKQEELEKISVAYQTTDDTKNEDNSKA